MSPSRVSLAQPPAVQIGFSADQSRGPATLGRRLWVGMEAGQPFQAPQNGGSWSATSSAIALRSAGDGAPWKYGVLGGKIAVSAELSILKLRRQGDGGGCVLRPPPGSLGGTCGARFAQYAPQWQLT